MQKYLLSGLILILSLLLLPLFVLAADEFQTNADTTILLDNGISLTIRSGAIADSMTVNTASIDFTLSGNSTVIIESSEKRFFDDTLDIGNECLTNISRITLPAKTTQTTVTVTPSLTEYCSSGGGETPEEPAPAPSGGGGGGAVTPTPATPATTTTETPAVTTSETTAAYPDGTLLRAEGDTAVYVIKDGQREHITSPGAFAAAGYNWADVKVVAASVVNSFAEYAVSAKGTLYRVDNKPEVYYVEKNLWRHIPSVAVFNSYNFSWSDIAILPEGGLDAFTPANLYRLIGGTKVYKIANGKKTWIQTAAEFNAAGYDWNNIVEVNAEELAYYPESTAKVLGAATETIIIKATTLRVRSLPSLSGNILTSVYQGEVYNILAEQDGWYKIAVKTGITGWCYGGDTGGYAAKQ